MAAAYGKVLRPRAVRVCAEDLTVDRAWEGDDEFAIGLP